MKAALLCFLLAGCASAPTVTKMLPPVDLLQDCGPVIELHATNGDLAGTILDYRKALHLCNNDKAALREWANKEKP